jgi:ATP-binding cassette subfamily B protein
VHFAYGIGNIVFRGLNLRIPHLFITAITGESGCGKSTLLLLIQKFYLLDAGNISIGDSDIRYMSTDLLRKHVATVPQHTDLFEGDFISNIALGEQQPDPEKILNICKRLGLHDFIDRLPHRYYTIIREQGMNLSGGQKQKIGIARALYADPSILILDEATSFLDPESERNVQDTLYWFYNQRKTIIIISHRLATIRFCKSIIFFIPGGGVISGTHERLLQESPEYMRWWGNTANPDVLCVRC